MPNEYEYEDVDFENSQIPERVNKKGNVKESKIKFAKRSFEILKDKVSTQKRLEEKYKETYEQVKQTYAEVKNGEETIDSLNYLIDELSKIGAKIVAGDAIIKQRMEFKKGHKSTPIKFSIKALKKKIASFRKNNNELIKTYSKAYKEIGNNIGQTKTIIADSIDEGLMKTADNEIDRLKDWNKYTVDSKLSEKEEIKSEKEKTEHGKITPQKVTEDIQSMPAPEFEKENNEYGGFNQPEPEEVDLHLDEPIPQPLPVIDDESIPSTEEKESTLIDEFENFKKGINEKFARLTEEISKKSVAVEEPEFLTYIINEFGQLKRDTDKGFDDLLESVTSNLNKKMADINSKEVKSNLSPKEAFYEKLAEMPTDIEKSKVSEVEEQKIVVPTVEDINKKFDDINEKNNKDFDTILEQIDNASPKAFDNTIYDEMAETPHEEKSEVEFTSPLIDHLTIPAGVSTTASDEVTRLSEALSPEQNAYIEGKLEGQRLRELQEMRDALQKEATIEEESIVPKAK